MFNKQPSDPNTPSKPTTNVPSGTTIVIIVVVIAVALFLVLRVFNPSPDGTVPQSTAQPFASSGDNSATLGRLVAARSIDRDGCAASQTNTFAPNEPIYVIAENSAVTSGTTIFVRLYRDNQAIEDAPEITANQNYQNTCINFVFEPTRANFQSGSYEAEIFVNGNAAGSIRFNVN